MAIPAPTICHGCGVTLPESDYRLQDYSVATPCVHCNKPANWCQNRNCYSEIILENAPCSHVVTEPLPAGVLFLLKRDETNRLILQGITRNKLPLDSLLRAIMPLSVSREIDFKGDAYQTIAYNKSVSLTDWAKYIQAALEVQAVERVGIPVMTEHKQAHLAIGDVLYTLIPARVSRRSTAFSALRASIKAAAELEAAQITAHAQTNIDAENRRLTDGFAKLQAAQIAAKNNVPLPDALHNYLFYAGTKEFYLSYPFKFEIKQVQYGRHLWTLPAPISVSTLFWVPAKDPVLKKCWCFPYVPHSGIMSSLPSTCLEVGERIDFKDMAGLLGILARAFSVVNYASLLVRPESCVSPINTMLPPALYASVEALRVYGETVKWKYETTGNSEESEVFSA